MPNRLAQATSPYLLQHRDNPVDWYEWGQEALGRARDEDRPILLSVGYAACHWCHVMERESFENEQTAALMNSAFVCVKVDREERPDVDAVYMDAVQAMTGRGGWPMTVFLTPDLKPFYAGTYFPPVEGHGLPAFPRVLATLAELWRTQRGQVAAEGDKVAAFIARESAPAATADAFDAELLERAAGALGETFDAEWGGFSPAPKFPQPMLFELLYRCHLREQPAALEMAVRTLDRMAAGGIHDQLGGGFHRYSTDRRWLVPHFEKMLYDNAQLALAYLHAHQLTGHPAYERVVRSTLTYLDRDLRHKDGGYFSAQDADSEGEEGRYFVWSHAELDRRGVADWFGALPEGNWEGVNVLWHPQGLEAAENDRPDPAVLHDLLEERERRVPPATDDKVLAAWNALAIRAFAEAGRALGEDSYVAHAVAAAEFVYERMRRPDGRLLRAWRDGRTSGPGFLDDHAGMALACVTLYETTADARWIEWALELGRSLQPLFGDPSGGAFYQVAADAEAPLTRPRDLFDNAVPSGNSLAAEVLLRLSLLTGDTDLESGAVSALRGIGALLERAPSAFGTALCALDLHLGPARELAVVGPAPARRPLLDVAWREFRPRLVIAAADSGAATVPLLEGRETADGGASAFVCERFACRLPVKTPDELAAQLAG